MLPQWSLLHTEKHWMIYLRGTVPDSADMSDAPSSCLRSISALASCLSYSVKREMHQTLPLSLGGQSSVSTKTRPGSLWDGVRSYRAGREVRCDISLLQMTNTAADSVPSPPHPPASFFNSPSVSCVKTLPPVKLRLLMFCSVSFTAVWNRQRFYESSFWLTPSWLDTFVLWGFLRANNSKQQQRFVGHVCLNHEHRWLITSFVINHQIGVISSLSVIEKQNSIVICLF